MKKVLVTGGAGFIGSHVVPRLLATGYGVRVLDNLSAQVHGAIPAGLDWLRTSGIEFMRGSVTCRADVVAALDQVDAIIHLAAETGTGQSMYEISRYVQANVLGLAEILDVIANQSERRVRRIVLASSRSVYGEGAYVCHACAGSPRTYPDSRSAAALKSQQWEPLCPVCGNALAAVPTRENDRVSPASVYAATKLAQEDLLRISSGSLDVDHCTLRLQNVYGEGQSLNNPYTGILSIFSTRIRRGLPLPIFEDGQETRDFVHVDDVARAFVAALAAELRDERVINVGSGQKTTVAEIAERLCAAFGAPADLVFTGQYRLGDIRHNRADTDALRRVLAMGPDISLEAGLRRFAGWVQTQPLPEDGLDRANAELEARNLMG